MVKIQASITAGIRPTSMIFHEQPNEEWTKYDFLFLEAYQALKNEMCSCGNPIWLCRSHDSRLGWKVDSVLCRADQRLKEKEWARGHKKSERPSREEKAEWGKTYFAVPYLIEGYESERLPTRRDFYTSTED